MNNVKIRVLFSDTTYDIIIGECITNTKTIKEGHIVAVVMDYQDHTFKAYYHNNHIVTIPRHFLIPLTCSADISAHFIPIIKNSPVIHTIVNHPSKNLLIISKCYNVFHLLQRMIPHKHLDWAPTKTSNLDKYKPDCIIDISDIDITPRAILNVAYDILHNIIKNEANVCSNIEFIHLNNPQCVHALRNSPTCTRFFKVCVH